MQGAFATVFLPVFFTLCTMVAYAWIDADADAATCNPDDDIASSETNEASSSWHGEDSFHTGDDRYDSDAIDGGVGGYPTGSGGGGGGKGTCGKVRLEVLAFEALWRAVGAAWALLSRILRPEAGDGAAAAVAAISLCSVAFFAVPTFKALEDAEQTYQASLCLGSFKRREGGMGRGQRGNDRERRGVTTWSCVARRCCFWH